MVSGISYAAQKSKVVNAYIQFPEDKADWKGIKVNFDKDAMKKGAVKYLKRDGKKKRLFGKL